VLNPVKKGLCPTTGNKAAKARKRGKYFTPTNFTDFRRIITSELIAKSWQDQK